MRVTVIGTGYVGLTVGLSFADFGNDVVCLDLDESKIEKLNSGNCPIYEPGAPELLKKNMEAGRLRFTTNQTNAILHGEVIFIAVGTPETQSGNAELSYVLAAAESIGAHIQGYTVVVDKSTVPVGTSRKVTEAIQKKLDERNADFSFDVVSNPEFLREGKALHDFMNPDRIIIGTESLQAEQKMRRLYNIFERSHKPIIVTTPETAEMIKYASNAFLATKITFINEIANLCDAVGADVQVVAAAMGKDGRISPKFLHPGPGYGGSCFPKDTKAIAGTAREYGEQLSLIECVIAANERQKQRAAELIHKKMGGTGTLCMLGLSFKPDTDDIREAPAITVLNALCKNGDYMIRVYDPEAMENAKQWLKQESIIWCDSAEKAMEGSDCLVVMTEWAEFRSMDVEKIRKAMRGNKVFDFRNIFSKKEMVDLGFDFYGIGV